MNFYKDKLLDHYNNPRNNAKLENADLISGQYNPSCGDSVEISAKINNEIISEICFTGKGCIISQAAASMLTEFCTGKSIEQIKDINQETILEMIGMPLGPTRAKCAFLAFNALTSTKQFAKWS